MLITMPGLDDHHAGLSDHDDRNAQRSSRTEVHWSMNALSWRKSSIFLRRIVGVPVHTTMYPSHILRSTVTPISTSMPRSWRVSIPSDVLFVSALIGTSRDLMRSGTLKPPSRNILDTLEQLRSSRPQ